MIIKRIYVNNIHVLFAHMHTMLEYEHSYSQSYTDQFYYVEFSMIRISVPMLHSFLSFSLFLPSLSTFWFELTLWQKGWYDENRRNEGTKERRNNEKADRLTRGLGAMGELYSTC